MAWTILGGVLAVVGVGLFASLYAATHGGSASYTIGPADLPPLVVTWAATIVVVSGAHELLHGLVVCVCGAQPRFGVRLVARVLPALYTTAPGVCFSRSQFVSIALVPVFVVSIVVVDEAITSVQGSVYSGSRSSAGSTKPTSETCRNSSESRSSSSKR